MPERGTPVIEDVVDRWHQYLKGELPGGLDTLLDDDVVFYSPIVFTPQRGKAVTTLYLQAAAQALPGDPPATPEVGRRALPSGRWPRRAAVTDGGRR